MDYFERVRKIVDYIEANLNNPITLDDLARQAFFSSYHFHRIFQTMVGDSVMEYIRKRRLAYAASDLRYSDQLYGNCGKTLKIYRNRNHPRTPGIF